MSSYHRRQELARLREADAVKRETEEHRVAGLSMYERIEEIESIGDVKRVLELICERAGLDIYIRMTTFILAPGVEVRPGDWVALDRETGRVRLARADDERKFTVPPGSRVTGNGYLEMPE